MTRTYIYNRYVRWGQYVFLTFFALFFLGVWAFVFYLSKKFSAQPMFSLWNILIPYTIAMLLLVLLCFYFFHRTASVKITLDDQNLIYQKSRRIKRFSYSDIKKVKSHLALGGGWLTIITPNQKIRLTVALEDFSEFILNLKDRLDHHDLTNRYQTKNMFKAFKAGVCAEQAYSRCKYTILIIALLTTLNSILSRYLVNYHFRADTTIFSYISLTLPWMFIPFITSEIILYRRTARQADLVSFTCPPLTPAHQKIVLLYSYSLAELLFFTLLGLLIFLVP